MKPRAVRKARLRNTPFRPHRRRAVNSSREDPVFESHHPPPCRGELIRSCDVSRGTWLSAAGSDVVPPNLWKAGPPGLGCLRQPELLAPIGDGPVHQLEFQLEPFLRSEARDLGQWLARLVRPHRRKRTRQVTAVAAFECGPVFVREARNLQRIAG